ncbi:MAG: hypothetical protein HYW91_01740 [Candidatus Sungbacteria bacterium]|nr:hypothetical protein [Candidatus Sungbacteria bacterium]
MEKNQDEKKELPANDHRALGQALDLFSFHDVSPGAVFWHPKGMVIVKELEKYIRKLQDDQGYMEISTPIMVKKKLFEKSGFQRRYVSSQSGKRRICFEAHELSRSNARLFTRQKKL